MADSPNEALIKLISEEVVKRIAASRAATAVGPTATATGANAGGKSTVPQAGGSPATIRQGFTLDPRNVAAASASGVTLGIATGHVMLGVSARHCHVTQEHLEILFGAGAQLTKLRDLRQPGEFASGQVLTVVGPRQRAIESVRILGPCRNFTQVELSQTDCIGIGVDAPVRPSGDHRDTPGITLVGPKGTVVITKGVIRANRHIHLHTSEAKSLGLTQEDVVMVKVGGVRPSILQDVQIRISDKFLAEMHLDTDDANSAGLKSGDMLQILAGTYHCGPVSG